MITTNVFKRNLLAYNAGIRRIVNKGGTSSSKTYSILQLLILIAMSKENIVISVVSETLPHLKKGAMKDFESILRADGRFNEEDYNRTDRKYFFGNSYIEFFSADQPGKATGPRRDILYINECNNLSYHIVNELEIRTNDCIFYDFNPVVDFWITDKVFMLPAAEFILIKSNYLDNDILPAAIKKDIQLKANIDPNFKKVHVDVEFGILEGLIFTNWTVCDKMPISDKQSHGLDFGFTNDPSTLMDIKIQNGELWVNELLYQNGMTNPEIAKFIKDEELNRKQIIADSSEPKSIEELHRSGISIKGAVKSADSVRQGIDAMKRYRINITKRSVNTIKEFRNYKWKQDKNGVLLNEPIDTYNHSIDAIRYAMQAFGKPITPAKFNFS